APAGIRIAGTPIGVALGDPPGALERHRVALLVAAGLPDAAIDDERGADLALDRLLARSEAQHELPAAVLLRDLDVLETEGIPALHTARRDHLAVGADQYQLAAVVDRGVAEAGLRLGQADGLDGPVEAGLD